MGEILGFFKKDNVSGMMLTQAIKRAEKTKEPVAIEIENTYVSFKTVISMKDNMLVVAKPAGINAHISRGASLRMRLAELSGKSVKLEVTIPHLNLANGASVFVAKLASKIPMTGREHLRFDTSRIGSLEVEIGGRETYRVVDMSFTGVRFMVPIGELSSAFPVGKPLPGKLIVKKHPVELLSLVPKTYKNRTVGCTMEISPDSLKLFEKVMNLIEANHEQEIMGKGNA